MAIELAFFRHGTGRALLGKITSASLAALAAQRFVVLHGGMQVLMIEVKCSCGVVFTVPDEAIRGTAELECPGCGASIEVTAARPKDSLDSSEAAPVVQQDAGSPKEKRKPYDIWSMSCALISLFCLAVLYGGEGSGGRTSLDREAATYFLVFVAMLLVVTSTTAFLTGIAGLFQFRTSRWLSIAGILVSAPSLYPFVIQAIRGLTQAP